MSGGKWDVLKDAASSYPGGVKSVDPENVL